MQKKPTPQNKTTDAKPQQPAASAANPSEKLAALLRKEGLITAKLMKAREELRTVQKDIQRLWEQRNQQAEDLLNE